MSVQPRGFLLWAMLAVAMPALGQTTAPQVRSNADPAQDVASTPNLSGRWAHPYLTGFEPPRSGPGPVRNRSRLPSGVANFQQLVGDYTNPILKPHAALSIAAVLTRSRVTAALGQSENLHNRGHSREQSSAV